MSALYDNFRSGLVSDNPLTAGALAFNSPALASLIAVGTSDWVWVTLDPAGTFGAPEVVKVTAHSAGSTTATIARQQQGSVARSHPANTVWIHGWTEVDAQEAVRLTQAFNIQTGTAYTLALTDRGRFVRHQNSGASTITVPPDTVVPFVPGDSVDGVQYGTGQITFVQGAGVTIRATPTLKTRAQYSAWTLLMISNNEWLLTGDLAST